MVSYDPRNEMEGKADKIIRDLSVLAHIKAGVNLGDRY